MNTSMTQRNKPSFYDICIDHSFNSDKLRNISTISGVPYAVIVSMCEGKAVDRSHAEKVLKAFSAYTQGNWTLENVAVKLSDGKVQHG